MAVITFVTLDRTHCALYETWCADPESQRWLGTPSEEWWAYIQLPEVISWLILADDEPIGHTQIDLEDDGSGSISLLVAPVYRRQGYGRQALLGLLAHLDVQTLTCLRAWIDPAHVGSQRLFTSVGFVAMPDDTDAMMQCYIYHTSLAVSR